MRNLIQFLWRYHFVLLFLFIETVSFAILVQYNSFHRANFMGSANEVSGNAFQFVNETTEYLKLKEVNEKISAENAKLLGESKNFYRSLTPEIIYFADSAHLKTYEFLSAKVLNNTVNKRNNYLTIDEGSRNNVNPQMGVISEDGVVGIVKGTSENFSSVISILHKNTQISSKLKNNDYFGILTWNGKDPKVAQLDDIPSHVSMAIGDTVVTRGSGTIFPPDIMVGTIKSFEEIKGTDFYSIDIDLSVDYKKVTYVYVVRNQLKIEQQQLESESEENDG